MTDALKTVRTRKTSTPQTKKAVKGQKKNNAGGYSFVISPMERVNRFLILGSESNFYSTGVTLSRENAKNLEKLLSDDATSFAVIDEIVAVSIAGRAPKQNPALFALALASSVGSDKSRSYALSKLPEVARTGTHLFLFMGYADQFRGWGRGLRRAVASWYTSKSSDSLAYQVTKYRSREGYTHRDAFRLSHPEFGADSATQALAQWVVKGSVSEELPAISRGFVLAQESGADLPALIREYGLTWEMLPTSELNRTDVWEALLEGSVPLGALIRQLPRLTKIGLLTESSATTAKVVARLTDEAELKRARIHPLAVLTAMKAYASGGRETRAYYAPATYVPVSKIVAALDKAFYKAFSNAESTNSRVLIGLDVSGSMGVEVAPGLSARVISAAFSLVLSATEPMTNVIGFTSNTYSSSTVSGVTELTSVVSSSRRLDDVVKSISGLPFGGTDCALPMLYAMEKGLEVDTFIVITDNETWAGRTHPHEALKQYRKKTGINAKLIVLGTSSSKFSIADPSDSGMLDLAGWDSAMPQVISDFMSK